MKLFDVVELAVDLPDDGLKAGTVGTIVDEYPDAYEVEFNDDDGGLLALTSVKANQLRPRG
jgi:uncharacterized protein DUF4926